jgi:hypothetical protein
MMHPPARRHYVTVFLLSLSLLMLEIVVARMLSVALLSHYAFVAVSLAMFGLSLGGLVVYLFPAHFSSETVDQRLVAYSWRFGLSVALSILAFLHMHVTQELSPTGFISLSIAYAVLAVPFFLGGVGMALLMTHFSASIGRLYAADLCGASLGCIAVVVAMQYWPAPQVAVCLAAALCLATLGVASSVTPRQLLTPGLACLAVGLLVILAANTNVFRTRYVKNWTYFYSEHEAWNAFSRVGVLRPESNAASYLPLKYPGERYQTASIPQTLILDIDGTAWTPMMHFGGDLATTQFLRESVLYAAYGLKPDADALIIGVGGGRDVLAAQTFGARSILGIEINPLMRRIVEERYGDYSGRPYTRPGVQVIIDEARSRLAQLDRRFDVIQLSLIDTFSLNSAGGFVFSENFLYTQEAFQEYFRHLSDDGILSLTRYFMPAYPVEVLRLLAMARTAWAEEGVGSVADHTVVLGQGLNATVLVKRAPFSEQELLRIDDTARQNAMRVLYRPGMRTNPHPDIAAVITTPNLKQYLDGHSFLIDPPTDDRPFFFNFLRSRRTADHTADPFQYIQQWSDALSLLYLLLGVVTTLAVVFLLGPLVVLARADSRVVQTTTAVPFLLYFACLGYGFMMVEIPLMQRFVLLLGYPVYALAVVLFALLLFSGAGSLLSSRVADARRSLQSVLVAIVMVSCAYVYFLPHVIAKALVLPIAAKIALTTMLLAPIGLLLGMAYPLGITLLRGFSVALIPWAWSLNGALSVVASVLAIFVGSRLGFGAAFLTGAAAYALALVSITVASSAAIDTDSRRSRTGA